MIRKLCAFLAALLVAVTLVACNTAQDSDKPDPDPGTEVGESLLYGIGEPFAGSCAKTAYILSLPTYRAQG